MGSARSKVKELLSSNQNSRIPKGCILFNDKTIEYLITNGKGPLEI